MLLFLSARVILGALLLCDADHQFVDRSGLELLEPVEAQEIISDPDAHLSIAERVDDLLRCVFRDDTCGRSSCQNRNRKAGCMVRHSHHHNPGWPTSRVLGGAEFSGLSIGKRVTFDNGTSRRRFGSGVCPPLGWQGQLKTSLVCEVQRRPRLSRDARLWRPMDLIGSSYDVPSLPRDRTSRRFRARSRKHDLRL
jgi:hypothetical protein